MSWSQVLLILLSRIITTTTMVLFLTCFIVTYMLTFATALIGYSFFVLTGSEYTFEGLKKTLRERRLKKLIKKTGFDEGKFKQLHLALSNKEHALHKILEEIAHNGTNLSNCCLLLFVAGSKK